MKSFIIPCILNSKDFSSNPEFIFELYFKLLRCLIFVPKENCERGLKLMGVIKEHFKLDIPAECGHISIQ